MRTLKRLQPVFYVGFVVAVFTALFGYLGHGNFNNIASYGGLVLSLPFITLLVLSYILPKDSSWVIYYVNDVTRQFTYFLTYPIYSISVPTGWRSARFSDKNSLLKKGFKHIPHDIAGFRLGFCLYEGYWYWWGDFSVRYEGKTRGDYLFFAPAIEGKELVLTTDNLKKLRPASG